MLRKTLLRPASIVYQHTSGSRWNRTAGAESGFTLVEVLVAIAIVAIVAVGLIGGMITASKILNSANLDETARDYAQAQLENIQNQSYIPINDWTTNPNPRTNLYIALSGSASGGYTISSTAQPVDEGAGLQPDTGVQKINVTVRQGTNTLFTLSGYKANY